MFTGAYNMPISNWPEGIRPRERMRSSGVEALSDAELLALFIRTGMRGKTALDIAREVLVKFEGRLSSLARADFNTLLVIPGIGLGKASQLLAALELARRMLREEIEQHDMVSSPQRAREWLAVKLGGCKSEVIAVLWLDSGNQLIAFEELATGTVDHVHLHPRELIKKALSQNATAAILVHNHPSGSPRPSEADKRMTHTLKGTLSLIDVKLLDHLIVCSTSRIISFAEEGLI